MHTRPAIDLAEAQRAISAVLRGAETERDRPIAVAVVGAEGDLISYARMDGLRPVPRALAYRKAYTAARCGSDSDVYAELLRTLGLSPHEMDPLFVAARGGLCMHTTGVVLGAIGVSGRTSDEDYELASLGVAALFPEGLER
jgi:uncharacterized protein GlcG (DUF336 family)